MSQQIEVGKTYIVRYPFVRDEVELPPDDPEATQMAKVKCWRPGVDWEQENAGSAVACADSFGEMLLTVVDMHKPGRFPTRVFYTRQWKDPDGRIFGKRSLLITTQERFRRISRGYRHEIWVDGEKQQPNACSPTSDQ